MAGLGDRLDDVAAVAHLGREEALRPVGGAEEIAVGLAILADLALRLAMGDEGQYRVILAAAGELDLAALRKLAHPLDEAPVAVLGQELGEAGVDVDGDLGVGMLLEDLQQGEVGLFVDLGQDGVELSRRLVGVQELRPVEHDQLAFRRRHIWFTIIHRGRTRGYGGLGEADGEEARLSHIQAATKHAAAMVHPITQSRT